MNKFCALTDSFGTGGMKNLDYGVQLSEEEQGLEDSGWLGGAEATNEGKSQPDSEQSGM